jgi:hypothetical protein
MATTSYIQATFFKADSEWTYTLALSIPGASVSYVAAEQQMDAWYMFLKEVPEGLLNTFEKEVALHHDTLMMTAPSTLARMSALEPDSSSQDIFLKTTRSIVALCNVLEQLREFQTDFERSGSMRTVSATGDVSQ